METNDIPGVSVGRRLAVGGMGELHFATRTTPGGPVPCVVKRLLPRADADARALFAREVAVLGALTAANARHIVHLHAAGPDAAAPTWFAMDPIDGVDLASLLAHRRKRGRPLPLPAVLALADGLTAALVELATVAIGPTRGVVHRDIHPGNVMIGRDGRVVLVDFGVASLDAASRTAADPRGTVAWMSPEQLRGAPVSPTTDLWATALVLWEALTGLAPLPPTPGLAALLAFRAAPLPAPSTHRADVPATVDGLVLQALAQTPEERPDPASWRAAWLPMVAAADPGALGKLAAQVADAAAEVRATTTAPGLGAVASPLAPLAPAMGAESSHASQPSAAVASPGLAPGAETSHASQPSAAVASPGLEPGAETWTSSDSSDRLVAAAPNAAAIGDTARTPDTTRPRPRARALQLMAGVGVAAALLAAIWAVWPPRPAPATDPTTASPRGDTPAAQPTPMLATTASSRSSPLPPSPPTAAAEVVAEASISGSGPAATVAPATPAATGTSSPTMPSAAPRPMSPPIAAMAAPASPPASTPSSAAPRGPTAPSPAGDTPEPTTTARAPRSVTVRVDAVDTPVHVTAGDLRGLAPLTSAPVAPEESMLLKLTGASPAFTIHARVRHGADGTWVAAFGAPAGQVHTVACGTSSPRPTPLPVVPVPRNGLQCRFAAADGRTFGARIVPAPTR